MKVEVKRKKYIYIPPYYYEVNTDDEAREAAADAKEYAEGVDKKLKTYVRPNLLDNAYFVGGGSQLGNGVFPINQRGQTIYAAGGGYFIDRWIRTGSNIAAKLNSGYIRFTKGSASANPGVVQVLDNKDIVGKKVTLSILYKTTSSAVKLIAGTDSISLPSSTSIALASVTSASFALESFGPYTNACLAIVQLRSDFATSDYLDIYALKLEIGESQTLAHKENGAWVLNEIPDYGIELAKCQRYLLKVLGNTVCYPNTQLTSGVIDFTVPIPVTMAATGTGVSIASGTFFVYAVGDDGRMLSAPETDFVFALSYAGTNAMCIRASKTSHGLARAVLGISGYALFTCEP